LARFLEEALQDYLGVVAKLLMRQQVNEHRSSTGLIQSLASHISTPNERSDFLRRSVAALKILNRR
jgi:hypothetical protein